jgi:uncharacterized repeat protein (TIGR02543 family)
VRGILLAIVLFSACSFAPTPGDPGGGGGGGADAAVPGSVDLIVTATGSGAVQSSDLAIDCGAGGTKCTASYPAGQMVTLDASPSTGQHLSGWTNCATTGSTCTFAITAATTVGASFAVSSYQFSVNAGHGTVTSSDSVVNCTAMSACNYTYAYATSVTLTASPMSNYTFANWTGTSCDNSTSPTCTLTVPAGALTMQAHFHQNGGGDD